MDIAALQLTLRRFAEELLQLADRTAISLHEGPGAKTHVLVDWENVQPDSAACRELVPEATDVWLFHGPNQKNVGRDYAGAFGDRVTPVRIARTGKNALDFHLAFYMGYIAAKHPGSSLVVLSNDKGYGPMLDHARELGFVTRQSGFGAVKASRTAKKAPARKTAAKRTAAKKAAAPSAARKVAAKKAAPAAKTAARKTPASAAKKAAPAAKTSAPAKIPAPPRASPPAKSSPAAKASAPAKKSFEQILALLGKSPAANRPGKAARLLAYIGSRIGADSKADAQAMLDRLVAERKVVVDDKHNVTYRL